MVANDTATAVISSKYRLMNHVPSIGKAIERRAYYKPVGRRHSRLYML
jgi:hypothetical protein